MPLKPIDLSDEQVREIIDGTYFPESRDYNPKRAPRPDDLTAEDVRAISEGNPQAARFQRDVTPEP